ncbi:MAG: hypothetical protein HYW86_00615 [Candidatus Roizmanbacteria bacterium]|nr:MAG: hypothetical protein HYW86_00615 [Candidatus Roizmanbacteria bacterium]
MVALPVYAQVREWGSCVVDGVPTLKCLEVIFGNILFLSSALIILALFIMFLVGSFSYLTSFGNPEKIKKAQGTLKYAIIGLVLFLSSYLILKTIDFIFLGNQNLIFNFSLPGP